MAAASPFRARTSAAATARESRTAWTWVLPACSRARSRAPCASADRSCASRVRARDACARASPSGAAWLWNSEAASRAQPSASPSRPCSRATRARASPLAALLAQYQRLVMAALRALQVAPRVKDVAQAVEVRGKVTLVSDLAVQVEGLAVKAFRPSQLPSLLQNLREVVEAHRGAPPIVNGAPDLERLLEHAAGLREVPLPSRHLRHVREQPSHLGAVSDP